MNNNIKTSNREVGIEVLRIVSMFMVVILHVLGQGGVLKGSGTIQYNIALFIEIMAYCAVNTFALISGYVGLNSKFKYNKLLYLYLQILFYSIGITLVAYILGYDINLKILCLSLLPLTFKMWWYISAYICTFLFMPILNNAIHNISKKQMTMFLISIFILCLGLPKLFGTNPYNFSEGYTAIWLIILYLFGAYLKKYNILEKISKRKSLFIFMLSCIISWSCILIINRHDFKYIGNNILISGLSGTFVSYLSIFIIINAVMLLSFFTKVKIKNKKISKIICILSSASLGVYLIHVHTIVWGILCSKFTNFNTLPPIKLIISIFLTAILIYLGCTVIELVRILIFKLFKIKKMCKKIDKKFSKYLYEE